MLKRIVIAAALCIMAACEMSPAPTPTRSDIQTTGVMSLTPTTDAAPHWVETEDNGVTLGCWKPYGWASDTTDGLLLAEHTMSISTGEPFSGAMIYIFVPDVEHLEIALDDENNFAMTVLRQVATNPEHIGENVVVSDPEPFRWGNHEAAYYLISSPEGFQSIVIGIELPNDHERLVVINMTMPAGYGSQLRRMLPRVLNDLEINGVDLSGTALEALPNPLDFPYAPHT